MHYYAIFMHMKEADKPLACASFEDGGALARDQTLNFDQALRTWTLWPARALHEEHDKGSIAAGKMADLAVLSADPNQTHGRNLFDIGVEATIWAGKSFMAWAE
jgi:predicted amidohydrolase YtcJ